MEGFFFFQNRKFYSNKSHIINLILLESPALSHPNHLQPKFQFLKCLSIAEMFVS